MPASLALVDHVEVRPSGPSCFDDVPFVEVVVYRSDVVGSLLRPAYLKEARDQFAAGKLSDAAFKKIEDRAIDECIDLQSLAGMEVITDGEVRRYAFYGHLIDAVEGFDKYGGWAIPFHDEKGEQLVLARPVVVSKLRRKRPYLSNPSTASIKCP